MAGNKLTVSARVEASTILEVVISMVVIVVVFGISMMIYANVLHMSFSVKKAKAAAILQSQMLRAEASNGNLNSTMAIDDFRIEQEVKPFRDDTLLTEIDLTAFDANQLKIEVLQKVLIKK